MDNSINNKGIYMATQFIPAPVKVSFWQTTHGLLVMHLVLVAAIAVLSDVAAHIPLAHSGPWLIVGAGVSYVLNLANNILPNWPI